jgi:prolipoprotein diacylglyceryl transferase
MEMMVVVGVPFGIVGARLYHVITDYQLYFGPGRPPLNALKIWEGGLGVWGAVAFGVLGGYLVARRRRIAFPAVLDAIAPAILVAKAIGRLGNWFNQELFGRPTTLPWALQIAPQYRPPGYEQFATFHPTFLYEMVWNLAAAALLVWLDRRFRLGHGKVFALYVLLYTAGSGSGMARCSPSTSCGTPPVGSGSRRSESTPSMRSVDSGSTTTRR